MHFFSLLGTAIVQVQALAAQADPSSPLAAINIAGHHPQPQSRCTRSSCLSSSWQDSTKDTNTNRQTPKTTKNVARPDGVTGWHPRKLDYRALTTVSELQPGRLLLVTHSDFETDDDNASLPVLAKMVDFDAPDVSEVSLTRDLAREVAMYRRLDGTGITPEFLGHVVNETGRAIGFLIEYIAQDPEARRNSDSMRACLAALDRLHEHSITHDDAHDGNCLLRINDDGSATAVLVDFELAEEAASEAGMARDLRIMDRCIRAIELRPEAEY